MKNCAESIKCCFKELSRSLFVRTFCLNEILANIYCALRGVSYDVRKQTEEIEDLLSYREDVISYHHELWAADEDVLVEKRKVFRIPVTSTLLSFYFYTFDKGDGQLSFNIHMGGDIVKSVTTSLEAFTIPINLQVSKSDFVEIEITDEDTYNPWVGLYCYVYYKA